MSFPTLSDLIADATPGGRGLLAAEIAQRTGRQDGPLDGKCEVCGAPADEFVLQDWQRWFCLPCGMAEVSAQIAVLLR